MDARINISHALAEAAGAIDQPFDLDSTLRNLAAAAQTSLPDFDHASITLREPDGRFTTGASTTPLALQLDEAQYAMGHGPCLDTVRGGDTVSVPRLRWERRWPDYVPHAVAWGVQSHLSVVLCLDGASGVSSLNLYSTTTEHVSLESKTMAELFGSYAVTGPRQPSTRDESGPASGYLQVMGQALGIVIDRLDLDPNSAFDYLNEAAARADLPFHDYAQQVVDRGGIP